MFLLGNPHRCGAGDVITTAHLCGGVSTCYKANSAITYTPDAFIIINKTSPTHLGLMSDGSPQSMQLLCYRISQRIIISQQCLDYVGIEAIFVIEIFNPFVLTHLH